jgi:WD40 repeat protein/serine/threonine protein kinase
MPPQKISHYTIQSELGHTNLADTYLAWDDETQTTLVVKSLLPITLTDPSVRGRYQLGMQIVASLSQPAIVPTLAFGEENGRPFIVMPFLPGGALSVRLAKGKLDFAEAVRIIQSLAPALDAAHALGITHGDIKPSNILFDAEQKPLLSDFGMTMFAESAAGQQSGVIIGPLGYISPETATHQADPERIAAQDVYMLGVLFYEMVMGHLPYTSETVLGYAVAQFAAPVPEITGLDAKTQKGVNAVMQRVLAKSPAERFASAGEFAGALSNLEKFSAAKKTSPTLPLPAQIRTEPIIPHLVIEAEPDSSSMQTIQISRQKPSRDPSPLLGCVGMLLAVAVMVVAIALLWGLALVRQGIIAQADFNRLLPTQAAAFVGTFMPSVTPAPPENASGSPVPTPIFTPTVGPSDIPVPATETAPASIEGGGTFTVTPTVIVIALREKTPLVPPTDYTTKSDDTIFSIAAQFNVDMNELIALNKWACDTRPAVGVPIQIPGAFTYGSLDLPDVLQVNNTAQFALYHSFECMGDVRDAALSADGKYLAVAVDALVYLWQVGDWKPYVTLKGHIGPVNRVRFSPDSSLVVTVSDDTSVRLWQVSDGVKITALYQHKKPVTDVVFFPDGSQFLSVSQEKMQAWSVAGAAMFSVTDRANLLSVAVDPTGKSFAVGGADSAIVYDTETRNPIATFSPANPAARLAFSPDSTLLASSSDVWHIAEKRPIYHLQTSRDSVLFSQDGQVLVTGRRFWQVSNGALLSELSSEGFPSRSQAYPEAIAMSPDGKFLLLGTQGSLTVWALPSSYQQSTAHVPPTYVVQSGDTLYSIASSHGVKLPNFRAQNGFKCENPIFPGQWVQIPDAPDAQIALSSAVLSPITVQNITKISPQRSLEMDCNITVSDLIFSSDNQKLISGSALWDIPSGEILIQATTVPLDLAGKPETDLRAPLLELSPDNTLLAMRADLQLSFWDVATGRPRVAWVGHEGPITSLAFSPDGTILASGSAVGDPAVRYWRVDDQKLEWVLPNYSIFSLMFSLDGQSLIAVGEDTVRVWSTVENKQRWALRGMSQRMAMSPDRTMMAFVVCLEKSSGTCINEALNIFALDRGTTLPGAMVSSIAKFVQKIQFSPDNKQVAATTDYGITVWNVADNKQIHWLAIPDRRDSMNDVWYSPDGSIIVSTDARQNLHFWDAAEGTLLYTIAEQPVDRLAFSPDGMMMAVLSQGTIMLWGVQP